MFPSLSLMSGINSAERERSDWALNLAVARLRLLATGDPERLPVPLALLVGPESGVVEKPRLVDEHPAGLVRLADRRVVADHAVASPLRRLRHVHPDAAGAG